MSDETRPDKIVSADGSAPKPYTDAEVEDLALRLNRAQFTDERVAEAVLDVAGGLIPGRLAWV